MLMCFDIGNTNVEVGVFDGDQLVERRRFSRPPSDRLADDYAVFVSSLFTSHRLNFSQISIRHFLGCAFTDRYL